jgi:hypothetical protein
MSFDCSIDGRKQDPLYLRRGRKSLFKTLSSARRGSGVGGGGDSDFLLDPARELFLVQEDSCIAMTDGSCVCPGKSERWFPLDSIEKLLYFVIFQKNFVCKMAYFLLQHNLF